MRDRDTSNEGSEDYLALQARRAKELEFAKTVLIWVLAITVAVLLNDGGTFDSDMWR